MSTYINTKTGEYPRHIGDIQLARPDITVSVDRIPDDWKEVEYVAPPASDMYDPENEVAYQLAPTLTNGSYKMQWAIRALTDEEKEQRKPVEPVILPTPDTTQLDSISGSAPDVIA